MFSRVLDSVIPIVTGGAHHTVEVIGTAVLVEDNDALYVVTAEHVIKEWGEESVLYLLIEKELYEIKGPVWLSDKVDSSIDLAIIPVYQLPELFALLWQRPAISLQEFDGSVPFHRECFVVYGFPSKRAKYDRQEKLITINPLRYFTTEIVDDHLYSRYKVKPSSHVLVKYVPKDTKTHDGVKVTAPTKPHGASGGPLLRALIADDDTLLLFVFEGILTDWKDNRTIIAAKKSQIKAVIEHFSERK
jgi:hypothetical protein